MSEAVQVAGCIAAAGAVAAAMLLPGRVARASLLIAALGLSAALVLGEAWDELGSLRERPVALASLALAAAAGLAALTVLIRRRPIALPLLVVFALPFRVPVGAGGEDANLLLPLYAVIAAGVISMAVASFSERGEIEPRVPRPLLWALAAAIVLYALQASYSLDVGFAARNVAFFLVPFAVMFVLLVGVDWSPRLLGLALAVAVAEAVVFALVGAGQFIAGEIFWNPALELSNDFHFYTRVNSLFWDPNIYGRYLAVVAVLVAAVVLWAREPRSVGVGALLLALISAGMVFAFSQTSFIAVLVGIGVLCALRYSAPLATAGTLLLLVAAFASVFLIGGTSQAEDDTREISSGRSTLIAGGVELFGAKPLAGHGSASFSEAFIEQEEVNPNENTISHNEAVTVAAEQGVLGLLAYAAVIAAAIWTLLTGVSGFAPGLGASRRAIADLRGAPGAGRLGRIALAAAFAAMLVHTVGYGSFLTDPVTWAILAIGGALATSWSSGRAGLQT